MLRSLPTPRSSKTWIIALAVIVSLFSHVVTASGCLRPFYPSIQQGLSNIVDPWHTMTYYRTKVSGDWGFEAVKIWDRWYGPQNSEFHKLMQDPGVKVIVYRPLYESGAPLNVHPVWENIDYGLVAQEIYQDWHATDKVVILTAREQDNQFYRQNNGTMTAAEYLDMMNARQQGVAAARAMYPNAALRIYNAAEVNWVPDQVDYSSQDILHQFIPNMDSPPDMISYSSWGGTAKSTDTKAFVTNIGQKLSVIQQVSGLPRDRIFVGEFAPQIDASSHQQVAQFLDDARAWGTRLVFLWQFNMGVLSSGEDFAVYLEPGDPLRPGFVLESGTNIPYAQDTVGAVQSRRALEKSCGFYW